MASFKWKLTTYQAAAVFNPFNHFAYYGGIATGKTYTGAHFAIRMIREHPDKTGFIGANSYDQLSQATLREFFYWLDEYGFEYVVDQRPPSSWGGRRSFKKYNNIISVRGPLGPITIFTRVLSDPNPLRGMEFSWYWIDESRDTPENTHDVILSRLRESDLMKGLITTTTNGEGWDYKRFVLGADGKIYNHMHIPTIESVKAGIISKEFYFSLLKSYSPLMAEQELFAQHVNIIGGRAYYASSSKNKMAAAPWGDTHPNPERPLIVGCDFNFQPAPCVWVVGQIGPYGYEDKIHWFKEVSDTQVSTKQLTRKLMTEFPGFFYEIYGDASGNRGTTSNAGETDYNQMAETLAEEGCMFTIDVDQSNPMVKDRVENMNAKLCSYDGTISMTYDPQGCPLLDADLRLVGWKQTSSGKGILSDNGDKQRTHSSDGAGYALFKKLPPGRTIVMVESLPSEIRKEAGI